MPARKPPSCLPGCRLSMDLHGSPWILAWTSSMEYWNAWPWTKSMLKSMDDVHGLWLCRPWTMSMLSLISVHSETMSVHSIVCKSKYIYTYNTFCQHDLVFKGLFFRDLLACIHSEIPGSAVGLSRY